MDPEYMNMIMEGLNRIVASEDINEIKQIASELLAYKEDEGEMEGEEAVVEGDLRAKLGKVPGGIKGGGPLNA